MENAGFAFVMVAAGIGIPIMAAMSGALARHLASAPAATAILFAVAFVIAAATTILTGRPAISAAIVVPRYLLLGGACVAFYALSITFIGPRFGIANAILCVLMGQMIGSAVIDQFGLLDAPQMKITGIRLLGIALMATGLYLARSARPPGAT